MTRYQHRKLLAAREKELADELATVRAVHAGQILSLDDLLGTYADRLVNLQAAHDRLGAAVSVLRAEKAAAVAARHDAYRLARQLAQRFVFIRTVLTRDEVEIEASRLIGEVTVGDFGG